MVGEDANVNPDAGNITIKESSRHSKPTSAHISCHSNGYQEPDATLHTFGSFAFCFLIDWYRGAAHPELMSLIQGFLLANWQKLKASNWLRAGGGG